jgi:hypothetical protein
MAERSPLVLVNGQPAQLPPGDQLANLQETLVSGSNIKTVNGNSLLGSGDLVINTTSTANDVYYDWDFLNTNVTASIWSGGGISSGTNNGTTASIVTAKHPGVLRLNSTTTANSGYRYTSGVGTTAIQILGAGVEFLAIARCEGVADSRLQFGFLNSNTAPQTNGAYILLSGVSASGVCVRAGAESTSVLPSLTVGNWYVFEVVINSTTSATFNIYNENGTLHGTTTITGGNIPTAAVGSGFLAYSVGTTGIILTYIDYIKLTIKNIGRA